MRVEAGARWHRNLTLALFVFEFAEHRIARRGVTGPSWIERRSSLFYKTSGSGILVLVMIPVTFTSSDSQLVSDEDSLIVDAVQKPLYENFDGRNWEVNEDLISARGNSTRREGSNFFDGSRDDYESRGSTMSLSPSRRDDRRNSPVFQQNSRFVNVFLIDEGKTVSVTNAQLVPLLDRYHEIPPFAICCTVGEYDTYHGKRHDFILECMQIVEYFMGAGMDGLEVEVLDKIHDGKDKLKVRLTQFGKREGTAFDGNGMTTSALNKYRMDTKRAKESCRKTHQ
ncbi:hypothetical protein KIN20_005869 [Parelaphostrongylus tenuis]|uniref:Uncharacterized protein n=1 Tax=Parelaphostrongylus tenuis TaxID=148309 RepID=A0AAD5MLR4_PARTN|nr:hypothetical protein KIN20_005869 [Parelaphostrongylus tenuis]